LLPHGPISQFYTSSIILDFGLGTIVGLISRMVPIDVPIPFKVAAAIMIGLGFTASMVLPSALPDLPLVFACGVPNALIVASAVVLERWGWSIKSALWLLLGNASYSIYLAHPFVTQTFAKMIAPAKTFGITNLSIIMFALIIASVVGIITYYLLEQPMLRITRRLLRRKRPQGQDSVTFRSSELRSRIL
jgi:peptidoglycan/LPS O-acetylase OafA/YrhL